MYRIFMILSEKFKKAYSLMEILVITTILVVLVGIIALQISNYYKKRDSAEKVVAVYRLLERAALAWQLEEGCGFDIKDCVGAARAKGMPNNEIFNGIAKYLSVTNSTVPILAKGRQVRGEKLEDVVWLPDSTKTANGNLQESSKVGVSKYEDGFSQKLTFYKLRNGATIMVNMAEYPSSAGYGFFDIDGIDGENKIGVDVFPFSIGADIDKKNVLYLLAANKLNPYFSSTYVTAPGLCNIKKEVCLGEKLLTNPTVFVIRWGKLPK